MFAMKYFSAMTTTINVSPKRQVELPADFCQRNKIKPGTTLRVTEVGDGLYVTLLPEPTEKELREVIAAAGSLARRQTAGDAEMVREEIAAYRASKRKRR
jgi:bifunctional DNA-binding transcriptional regulator/antitoxin component of YhaV-PrlF toxin-antitoxin module